MASHSSILTWRNSQMEEAGGLHSMESQRVRTKQLTLSFLSLISQKDPQILKCENYI